MPISTGIEEDRLNAKETIKAIEIAIKYSRPLIKPEWDRVKEGEPAFKNTRNGAIIGIIVLCLAVICFIAYGVFS